MTRYGVRMLMKRPRVLLVDDFDDARDLYTEYLRFHGYDVVPAADGLAALEAARAHRPDIVLLDIRMPGMNGFEAMRALRAEPYLVGVPIVALTARAMANEREATLRAGFDGFIAKPVLPAQLLNELKTLLTSRAKRDGAVPGGPSSVA